MVKKGKKRSLNENESAENVVAEVDNVNNTLQSKKPENGAAQNGQTNKKTKKELKVGEGQDTGFVESSNKKETGTDKKKSPKRKYKINRDLPIEFLKDKIELIQKRGDLSRTAKRRLSALKKVVLMKEGKHVPGLQVAKNQTRKGKNDQAVEAPKKKHDKNNEKQKKKIPVTVEVKSNKNDKKKAVKQSHLKVTKEDEDDDEEVESEEGESKALLDSDVEDEEAVDDEEEDEDDEEDDDEDVEDEDDEDEDEDEDDEEEEDEEEDDEEDDDDDDEVKKDTIQSQKVKAAPKQTPEQDPKKKRFVLFVGNLPYEISVEEVKKHFLTKASHVVDIRIPKKDGNTGRGFAYVELANQTDYEKALSLHQSFINGRRINVQYSGASKGPGGKKDVVVKNMKLHALRKAGKLAGGHSKNFQKNDGRKGKQHMRTIKT